jgi:hypothetical protein
VSQEPIRVAASLSVDLHNGVLLGGVQESRLSEEQVEGLMLGRASLRSFLSENGVAPVARLWIVCGEAMVMCGVSTPSPLRLRQIQGSGC